MHLLILRTGAVLLVWPDGRAIRVERDGATSGAAGVRKIACITR